MPEICRQRKPLCRQRFVLFNDPFCVKNARAEDRLRIAASGGLFIRGECRTCVPADAEPALQKFPVFAKPVRVHLFGRLRKRERRLPITLQNALAAQIHSAQTAKRLAALILDKQFACSVVIFLFVTQQSQRQARREQALIQRKGKLALVSLPEPRLQQRLRVIIFDREAHRSFVARQTRITIGGFRQFLFDFRIVKDRLFCALLFGKPPLRQQAELQRRAMHALTVSEQEVRARLFVMFLFFQLQGIGVLRLRMSEICRAGNVIPRAGQVSSDASPFPIHSAERKQRTLVPALCGTPIPVNRLLVARLDAVTELGAVPHQKGKTTFAELSVSGDQRNHGAQASAALPESEPRVFVSGVLQPLRGGALQECSFLLTIKRIIAREQILRLGISLFRGFSEHVFRRAAISSAVFP